ncbi:MAG: 30S ribosomal protein S12 methylthiotransferase RimO [Desulfobulbus propionicus]|nr:MAG: 30S ribosomal protein S12 methylthiotransferase RimO [Desulfobulbus propionicus]
MKNTIYIVSLGCPKNLVDTEVMLGLLDEHGYLVVEDPAEAAVLLVNTCGFIQPAVEEAVDVILELAAYKQDNPAAQLVVIGCMVQRYGEALAEELPEVDVFLGLDELPHIINHIESSHHGPVVAVPDSSTFLMDAQIPRKMATPFFRSFLKITEGCDNRCSYCMIPSIRGALRSRTLDDLVAESRKLEQNGVRELTLIAQDLTAYGDDLGEDTHLVSLLEKLLKLTRIPWFRLLYLYPSTVPDALLHLLAQETRIVPYLDIPFQHASDNVLRRMNRRHGLQELDELVQSVQRIVPDCVLRTTMLVGFPGETEEDIDILLDALQRWQLDHVGVFQYQDEEGSPAEQLAHKIAEDVKQDRYERVMELQAAISKKRLQNYVGREELVLVEGLSRESDLLLEGRTRFQAPDIDGCVYITSGQANSGDIVTVRVTEAHTYDLVGEIVEQPRENSE